MARLNREAWLEAGLELLKHAGDRALTVDRLSRHVGATKGSFYHHFESREEFANALLSRWEERLTHRLIEASSAAGGFAERDLTLTQLGEELFEPELEVAIRAWALRDRAVMEVQERVDRQRRDYLKELFRLVTADPEAAAALAIIRYAFYVGAQQTRPALSPQRYTELLHLLQRALLASVAPIASKPEQERNDDGGGP